jgi:hypothetical protein
MLQISFSFLRFCLVVASMEVKALSFTSSGQADVHLKNSIQDNY